MKLNKHQHHLIEDYLVKNKVNYWDVRMELLDHIATNVQKRMDNGQTFDEALIAVHLSFGNKFASKKLSKDQKRWIFTESIYADNTGYKKLIKSKQLELQKTLRKQLGKAILVFFKSPITLILYATLVWVLFKAKYWFVDEIIFLKALMVVLFIGSIIPLLLGLLQLKKSFRSLYLSNLIVFPLLSTGLLNLSLNLPGAFIMGENKGLLYGYLAVIVLVLTPIIYVQIKLSITMFREYHKIHKMYLS